MVNRTSFLNKYLKDITVLQHKQHFSRFAVKNHENWIHVKLGGREILDFLTVISYFREQTNFVFFCVCLCTKPPYSSSLKYYKNEKQCFLNVIILLSESPNSNFWTKYWKKSYCECKWEHQKTEIVFSRIDSCCCKTSCT